MAKELPKGVYLISCVSEKREKQENGLVVQLPCCAEYFYVSDWFIKAREAVKTTGCWWFILSAKYGLMPPDTVITTYDRTLKKMKERQRLAWAGIVVKKLKACYENPPHFVILAGLSYREFLVPKLIKWGATVDIPLEGLSIGRQLQEFKEIISRSRFVLHGRDFHPDYPRDPDRRWAPRNLSSLKVSKSARPSLRDTSDD